jgi:hypothetical protein
MYKTWCSGICEGHLASKYKSTFIVENNCFDVLSENQPLYERCNILEPQNLIFCPYCQAQIIIYLKISFYRLVQHNIVHIYIYFHFFLNFTPFFIYIFL